MSMPAAQTLRKNLHVFPHEYLPEISYTIEEVVAKDCYGLLGKMTSESWTVIDIGANFGIFSIAAFLHSYRHNSRTRIIAIEPNPPTFCSLVKTTTSLIDGLRPEVELGCHAFGDGRLVSIDQNSSPFKAKASGPGGAHQTYAMPLAEIMHQYAVQGPVLLKIDCEGGETALLDDAGAIVILRDILAGGGHIGLEVHWGDKYPNLSKQAVVDRETWSRWCCEAFSGYTVTFDSSASVGIIRVSGRKK